MKKETIVKFCCHKCGKHIDMEGKPLNCPHCEHDISWMRITVVELFAQTIYEVLV